MSAEQATLFARRMAENNYASARDCLKKARVLSRQRHTEMKDAEVHYALVHRDSARGWRAFAKEIVA